MGRPTKAGLDFFPLDVSFETKEEMFITEYGVNAFSFLVASWQIIYSENGYFDYAGDDFLIKIKRKTTLDISVSTSLLHGALRRKIFDVRLFNECGILTSRGIQKRYFEAAKRKKEVIVKPEYLLIDVSAYLNVSTEVVSVTFTGVNVNNNSLKEEEKEEEKGKEYRRDLFDVQKDALNVATIDWLCERWNSIEGVKPVEKIDLIGAVKKTIELRIKEKPTKEFWDDFFNRIVSHSDFLCGRTSDFQATLYWACRPLNFSKIRSGLYKNKNEQAVSLHGKTCIARTQEGFKVKVCGKPAEAIWTKDKKPFCHACIKRIKERMKNK